MASAWASALDVSLQSFTIAATSASPDIKLFVEKTFYDRNESIELYGVLYNVTASSGVASVFTPLSGQAINVTVFNSTSVLGQYALTTDANGSFYSNSTYYPAAVPVYAPNQSGSYTVRAQYNASGTLYASSVGIIVGNQTVDQLLVQPDRFEYSPGQAMNVTLTAQRGAGTQTVRVSGVFVNGTMRYPNQTILQAFACTTNADGFCTVYLTAPGAGFGSFFLEANNYLGFAAFYLSSFSVDAGVLDADGQASRDVFAQGETGNLRVLVSVNGTLPSSGTYSANATLGYSNGTILSFLPVLLLDADNSYVNRTSFGTSGLQDGTYLFNVTVSRSDGLQRVQQAVIQIKGWSLSVSKAASGSGFEFGDVTLPNATLRFEALPQNRTSGAVISGLASAFSYQIKTPLGVTVSNGTAVLFNASCGISGCYEFNVSAPSVVGSYSLGVSVTYAGVTRVQSRSIFVDGFAAVASTLDSAGMRKAVFGPTEFLNVNFSARNATADVNVSSAQVAAVVYASGLRMNYTETSVSLMNASDDVLQWAWNASSNRLVLDVPKIGGLYSVELYVNNGSAKTSTRFFSNPYDTCFSAKASLDEGSSDYVWQFKPSDTLYLQLTVLQAENTVSANSSTVEAALGSASYGRGSACRFDSTRKQAVLNASLSILQALNLETGHAETLNATASTCQSLSTSGHYLCTLKPNASAWESGRHEVSLSIRSQDGLMQDVGTGYFETRVFFVYGYPSNWINKPSSNITMNLQAYEAGSGWWSSSTGLSGTATLQRVEFRGNFGEWFSTGTPFEYNTTGLNGSSVTNGQGTLMLTANRTPSGAWPTGFYTARVRLTASDGREDFGDVYFEIRNWDAWAQQVQNTGSAIQYRYSNAPDQNVSLYMRITQAGDYGDSGGTSLGGNLTVRVKKISTWDVSGQVELAASEYSAPPITINQSSPYAGNVAYATHLLTLSPATRWPSGSYNVLLELNGSVNGTLARQQSYGWFTIKAFHAESQPVNLTTGAYAYQSRGRSDLGFNITTALDQQNSYSGSSGSLINTTIVGLKLYRWVENVGQQELAYPADLRFSPSTVNGTGTINVSKISGNWPAGWYWGEMRLRDNQSNEQTANLWFGIRPFQFSVVQNGSAIGYTQNLTGTLALTDTANGLSLATATSNYTLISVREVRYTNNGQQSRDAIIYGNASWNGSTRAYSFGPPADTGRWSTSGGWLSLQVTVRDESDNNTDTYWLSSSVQPFSASAVVLGSTTMPVTSNVSLNVTLSQPDGTGQSSGNLSRIQYYDYASSAYQSAFFIVGNCYSWNTSGGCLVNSTAYYGNGSAYARPVTVVVAPPQGTWPEGYNYLDIQFAGENQIVRPASSPYLYARAAINAYHYPVDPATGSYQYSFGVQSNVGYRVYGIQNINGVAITANATRVEHYAGNEWRENSRTYSDLSSFGLVGQSSLTIPTYGATLNVTPPIGGWPTGSNYLRVSLVHSTNASQTGTIKSMYFWVTS
ncbi:hypothetical protein HYV43_04035 [Candidatus Micrarchaeota archaeon]|nr:hypothetical protein [Candidatus Micrarchaeota archaeon]